LTDRVLSFGPRKYDSGARERLFKLLPGKLRESTMKVIRELARQPGVTLQ
jgi:hypothetical protein